MNKKKVLRSQTDTFYDSAEKIAEAIKKEKAYAEHLNKDSGALTTAERRQALVFEPPKDEKQAKKKEDKALKAKEDK